MKPFSAGSPADVTAEDFARVFGPGGLIDEFFQRRLAVEGETETGLHLKNLLDGWEYDLPAHLRAVLPGPVASLTLHGLSRLRPAGNHHSSHPEAPPAGTRPWRRPR